MDTTSISASLTKAKGVLATSISMPVAVFVTATALDLLSVFIVHGYMQVVVLFGALPAILTIGRQNRHLKNGRIRFIRDHVRINPWRAISLVTFALPFTLWLATINHTARAVTAVVLAIMGVWILVGNRKKKA